MAGQQTALYRLFGAENVLLYVGITTNPASRWREHANIKTWWPLVARREVEWHDNRADALAAEAAAICDENPMYNILRRPYRPFGRLVPTAHSTRSGDVACVSIQSARQQLRDHVDAAREDGQHTVIERHGRPVAVLVPVIWYVSKGGDPREPLPEIPAED